MKDYFAFWRRYGDFNGKTTVHEFWNAILWGLITEIVLSLSLPIVLIAVFNLEAETVLQCFRICQMLFGAFSIVPLLAVTVRRLRDAGYSCKSFFWLLLPGIGMIAFLARLCSKSAAQELNS